MRIFPAFYVFLVVMVGLDAAGVITLGPDDALAAATYTMNFHPERAWAVGYLWSLSVQEQFYLLWPVALLLAGPRRAMAGAAVVVLLAPLLRVGAWLAAPWYRPMIDEGFPTVCDSIAVGCLLAGVRGRLGAMPRYLALLRSGWTLLLAPLLVAIVLLGQYPSFTLTVGQSVANVAIALLIDRFVRYPGGALGRFLNWRPVAALGTLSYSLYLWQQPLLDHAGRGPLQSFPMNIVLAVTAAYLSYRLVERSFLALRPRLERRLAAAAAP